jgi:hypothetical protein
MKLGNKLRRLPQVWGLTAVARAKHARVTTGFIRVTRTKVRKVS